MRRSESRHGREGPVLPRHGDSIEIRGDYQHRALTQGNRIQRFWHYSKILAIEKLLPPRRGDQVVDVGCGSGVITDFLARCGAHAVGIDANPDAIRFAQQTYASPRTLFRHGLADQSLGQDASADKVYCLELIEHIHASQASVLLDHVHHLLRPGGRLFLTTPNYHSLWPVIEWLMDRLGLAPHMAGHQHVELYNRKKLRRLFLASGFSCEFMGTMCFLAPWIAPLSWRCARRLARVELGASSIPGCLVVCVLSKGG